ncbi:MAG: GerMN domain-containing protein [Eubacterium sp.]|nr:GerMN domain-containing protein [Eubacterium sp.]
MIGIGLVMGLLLIPGCGDKDAGLTETVIDTVDSNLSEDHGITIYRVEGRSVVAEEEKVQLKQPDSVANSLEETMDMLPLVDGVKFLGYTMGENNSVTLSFQISDDISKEILLLEKAAVVTTIEQIRKIGAISLSIRNSKDEVVEEGNYTSKSFYYYDSVIPTGQNNGQVTLYLPEAGGTGLVEQTLVVTLQLDASVEEEVVKQLISRQVFPSGTELISISVTQKVAYVDFNEAFLQIKDPRAVYSLVDSICKLPHINSIQILVNGEKQEKLAKVDTHMPLQYTKLE